MRAMLWAGPADLMSLIRTDEMGRGAFKACRERERGSRMEQRRLLSCISLCVPLDFSHHFYTPPFVSLINSLYGPAGTPSPKTGPPSLLNWGSGPSSCATPRTGGKLRVAVARLPLGPGSCWREIRAIKATGM